MSRINERLKNKDYVTRRVANPFDDLGKEVEIFRKGFNAATQARKVKGKSFPQSRTAYASFFTFASNTKDSWGFDDAAEFDFAKEYIDTYFEGNGQSYDPARLIPINDNLTKYSRNIDGIKEMVEDAYDEKKLTNIQAQLLKITATSIAKASDAREASSINATIESEVFGSGIAQNDKNLVLSVNSILAYNFQDQISRLPPLSGKESNTICKKVVAVVIIVVAAAAAAVGAVAGGIVGLISCCVFQAGYQASCDWNCIGPYVREGAILGGTLGLVSAQE